MASALHHSPNVTIALVSNFFIYLSSLFHASFHTFSFTFLPSFLFPSSSIKLIWFINPSPLLLSYLSILLPLCKQSSNSSFNYLSFSNFFTNHYSLTSTLAILLMAALCSNRNKLIQELLQGRKFANQLQVLLHDEHKPFQQQQQQDGLVSSRQQELVLKILRSFTETLSVLSSCTTTKVAVSDNSDLLPNNSLNDSPCTDDRRLEDSGESKKRPAGSTYRRGCYKRK